MKSTLDHHNSLRAKHGAQPLKWSDECAASAQKQADACQRSRKLFHGFCEGPSGGHGQNAYWHSASAKPEQAIQSWYDEVNKPGYDFKRHGFAKGTGHFTQVVWVDTRSVGMAVSKDGKYIVANCERCRPLLAPLLALELTPPGCACRLPARQLPGQVPSERPTPRRRRQTPTPDSSPAQDRHLHRHCLDRRPRCGVQRLPFPAQVREADPGRLSAGGDGDGGAAEDGDEGDDQESERRRELHVRQLGLMRSGQELQVKKRLLFHKRCSAACPRHHLRTPGCVKAYASRLA